MFILKKYSVTPPMHRETWLKSVERPGATHILPFQMMHHLTKVLLSVTKSDQASGNKPQAQWSHAVPSHFLSCQVEFTTLCWFIPVNTKLVVHPISDNVC